MSKDINRRSFIKMSTILGGSTLIAGSPIRFMQNLAFAAETVDIAAVKGTDYFKNTIEVVNLLGGMKQFVKPGSTVGLLINSPWDYPGSYVTPEIPLAVVQMCLQAGAKEVGVLKSVGSSYWNRSPLASRFQKEIGNLRDISGDYVEVQIPKGVSLKDADVARGLLECDVFINVSIAKDHTGTRFSGVMKNMMGTSAYTTNAYFHHGSGSLTSYSDVEFLSQCIADLNLVRKPDLCILDGTEILKTNGPRGPGELLKPQKVIAGVDRVAVDSYGAQLLGLLPEDIHMIRMAHAHGLGEMDLAKIRIQEAQV